MSTITELFADFKFKPGDFVLLAMQAASLERVRQLESEYDNAGIPKPATEAPVKDWDDYYVNSLKPRRNIATNTPLPVMFQISSRAIVEGFGGVITLGYSIEGETGAKFTVHEDELVPFVKTTKTADVDSGANT